MVEITRSGYREKISFGSFVFVILFIIIGCLICTILQYLNFMNIKELNKQINNETCVKYNFFTNNITWINLCVNLLFVLVAFIITIIEKNVLTRLMSIIIFLLTLSSVYGNISLITKGELHQEENQICYKNMSSFTNWFVKMSIIFNIIIYVILIGMLIYRSFTEGYAFTITI